MKLFSAPSLDEAMALMRAEMGPDAVILSTRDEDGRAEVRAAVERTFAPRIATSRNVEPAPFMEGGTRERLIEVLSWHGAPRGFVDVIANAGVRLVGSAGDPQPALAAGLEGVLLFEPVETPLQRSLLVVGPPGGGKTSVTAKLAMRAGRSDHPIEAVAADFDNNGDAARLSVYLQNADLVAAKSPAELQSLVAGYDRIGKRAIIDGPGFNPLDEADMALLNRLAGDLNVEPILALSAEGHPEDLQDTARAFANIGAKRAIITKLDAVRRRGGVISALSAARLSIAQLAMAPFIDCGLVPASPVRLARLLLETAPESVTGAAPLKGAA